MNPKGSKTKVGQDKSEIIADVPLACADEKAATEFLEQHRWEGEPGCPCCGSTNVYQMKDSKSGERQKNFRWRCRDCKRQFTVRTGTVMEDSRIPLKHWCYAFWRASSSKKGVSALEIKRHTGLSYKSALFLMHRIRFAMVPSDDEPKLDGVVEADETYFGGKPRYSKSSNPRGTHGKQAVLAAVERDGRVRTKVVPDVTAKTLKRALDEHVEKSARLMTDEHASYTKLGLEYEQHEVIRHKAKEYVRGDVTTNTIEGFFSLLKRGIYGVYHNVSRKHLQRYMDEFEFRYNYRKLDDGGRMATAIRQSDGRRLRYRECHVPESA